MPDPSMSIKESQRDQRDLCGQSTVEANGGENRSLMDANPWSFLRRYRAYDARPQLIVCHQNALPGSALLKRKKQWKDLRYMYITFPQLQRSKCCYGLLCPKDRHLRIAIDIGVLVLISQRWVFCFVLLRIRRLHTTELWRCLPATSSASSSLILTCSIFTPRSAHSHTYAHKTQFLPLYTVHPTFE